ncbi:uncharacterized protein METZ01_LOCUS250964, partial [marine metagenome]
VSVFKTSFSRFKCRKMGYITTH